MSKYDELYKSIGYTFADEALLALALTHTTVGQNATDNYERLEFLGDALLDYVVGAYVYDKYPDIREGELTSMRKAYTNKYVLSEYYDEWRLRRYIKAQNLKFADLGPHKRSGFVESIIGAVLKDGGQNAAVQIVYKMMGEIDPKYADYVSRIYEHCNARKNKKKLQIEYDELGDIHSPKYRARVLVDGQEVARAEDVSKAFAKRAACCAACEALGV